MRPVAVAPSTQIQNLTIEKVKHSKLHSSTRHALLICRFFGLFPVSGLTCSNKSELRFKLLSPYNIICALSAVGQLFISILSLCFLIREELHLRNVNKFCNNLYGFILTLMVTRLGTKWPMLIREVANIEKSLPPLSRRNMTKICTVVTVAILIGAFDYTLSTIFYSRLSKDCFFNGSMTESYFTYTVPWAFNYTTFSYWKALTLELFLIQQALLMSFTDTMVAIISIYLTAFFEDLNEMVVLYSEKPGMWSALRTQYTRLTYLVRLMNSHIAGLILMSFGSNLILICVQVFKILKKDKAHDIDNCDQTTIFHLLNSPERLLFFVYTFVFRVGRTLFAGLMAARLHSYTKSPLNSLHEVDTPFYTAETQRFLEQINMTKIALSGYDFFYVTRSMILSMTATIVTYVLVLLQFTG